LNNICTMVIRCLLLAILGFLAWPFPSNAGEGSYGPDNLQMTRIDWQGLEALPPQARNHCSVDFWNTPYCSDHCGKGYQFYFCSGHSSGCCHVGVGYCDWNGSLRCAPTFGRD
jgi:hypothetical protein